jgi:MFS family permease
MEGIFLETKHAKLTYLGLPRSVYVIFFARVVNSMGNFVHPFMTLLLTSKGGMGEETIGLFLLLSSTVQVPGSLLGGKLADKMGRKKIMIIFMGLAALCLIPCAFLLDDKELFQYIPWLLILSSYFGSVAGPASGAMMNDLTLPENRQAAFSLLYMGINVGTALGSIIAGLLFNNFMKFLFIGDAITTLLSILLLALLVKETKPEKEELEQIIEERIEEKAESGGLLKALLKRPALLIFAVFDMFYSFVYAQTNFSLPLQTKLVFGEQLGASYFGTFAMINCLEVIFLTTIITLITRKIRAVYNVAISGIFFAVGFGMLFFVESVWLFVLSTLIWTVGEIINATNIGVYIANHTPITHRGRFNSIINIITGTGGAISPYLMGRFIAGSSVTNVWPIIFVISLIAALSMYLLGTYEKRKYRKIETENQVS